MGTGRILLVEDSRAQAERLSAVLVRDGYQVEVAGTGEAALQRVREAPPDLVILDMILPDMDGLEVLRSLKDRTDDQFIPVIGLSVKSDVDARVAGLRTGADDYLAKPFADAEILARTSAMLRIKRLQDQLRAGKSRLEQLCITDGLTGLHNLRHFRDRLQNELRRSQRYAQPLALLMLDLDHFKDVNDRYGHLVGDRVLCETARVLRSCLRVPDVCARYGGEEFAIILPCTELDGAVAVAARILAALREQALRVEPWEAGSDRPVDVRVTASIGVAGWAPGQEIPAPDAFVARADEALYAAKRAGRDSVRAEAPGAAAPAHAK